jgi:hypothetical protein
MKLASNTANYSDDKNRAKREWIDQFLFHFKRQIHSFPSPLPAVSNFQCLRAHHILGRLLPLVLFRVPFRRLFYKSYFDNFLKWLIFIKFLFFIESSQFPPEHVAPMLAVVEMVAELVLVPHARVNALNAFLRMLRDFFKLILERFLTNFRTITRDITINLLF